MYIFELNLFGLHIAPSYYGLMYVLGFLSGYFYLKHKKILTDNELESLFFYVFLGVLLGGRIGYMMFYDLSFYLNNPLSIVEVWKGGMSFHGGFLGVLLSLYLFCRKYQKDFFALTDKFALIAPIGIFFGRIGNYLNKELLGFPYNGFLAVEKNGVSYFPAPLLEAMLEGVVLFLIIFFITRKNNFIGKASFYFLIFYGVFRIFVELFFRLPDSHLGYIFSNISMGMLLSLPMILIGVGMLFVRDKK